MLSPGLVPRRAWRGGWGCLFYFWQDCRLPGDLLVFKKKEGAVSSFQGAVGCQEAEGQPRIPTAPCTVQSRPLFILAASLPSSPSAYSPGSALHSPAAARALEGSPERRPAISPGPHPPPAPCRGPATFLVCCGLWVLGVGCGRGGKLVAPLVLAGMCRASSTAGKASWEKRTPCGFHFPLF